MSQDIALPNGNYTLKFWVRSSGGQKSAKVYVKNYGGVEMSVSANKNIGNWTQMSIDNIPVTDGKIQVGFASDGNAGNWLMVDDFTLIGDGQPAAPPEQKSEKISLKKGQKVSLTKKQDQSPIRIECGWTAPRKDYDLKALVRYRNGQLIYIGAANADERLSTPDGAVRHGGDVKNPGELEHIEIKWHPDIASVAVSSYSALENGYGSFREYGVFVRIINGKQIIEIPAADTSAKGDSYTLCFGEILFGASNTMDVVALEMYSRAGSEHRIGYVGDQVKMDIGPSGKLKK